MKTPYNRVWAIRGTLDVNDDIYLLPGDRLRLVPNNEGVHRVVVLEGNEIWENCMDLVEQPGKEPVITDLPIADSESMSDGGTYADAIRRFVSKFRDYRRLVGTLKDQKGVADIAMLVAQAPHPADPSRVRKILIIKAVHQVSHDENGTGHGD